MALPRQRNLFCPCGRAFPAVAGLCRPCYRAASYSRRRFSGLRDQILARDGYCCRACGSSGRLHVHHRRPGVNRPELLITVCARCHARLHRFLAIRRWIPALLAELWAEQHLGRPLQLQFPLAA